KLPVHQGHFFNWYHTIDRHALEPRYISSVDNGNLAGHLLAVAQALEAILKNPLKLIFPKEGICSDSLRLLKDAISLSKVQDEKRNLIVDQAQIIAAANELDKLLLMPSILDKFTYWKMLSSKAETLVDLSRTFVDERGEFNNSEILYWSEMVEAEIASHRKDLVFFDSGSTTTDISDIATNAIERINKRINFLVNLCRELFKQMDFNFLYEHSRKLFSIGYRLSDNSLDASYYDLLASEARLLSFIAIAKGDVSSKHWFRLGRALTPINEGVALVSWSGSMFEYLMPSLVMNTPVGSLLEQTCRLVVKKQILYGAQKSVPWGISESAYNERDVNFTYQYSNFGIPGLGLKRGLENDLVISPYSTILAAMYDPLSAAKNIKQLSIGSNFA
ncbi:MAG: hypothetical protein HQK53_18230, partial [Oligoflexia bacterium]|nr:hypothetical protein [Oligoflexia bacterium]